jgi:hypothetical protein
MTRATLGVRPESGSVEGRILARMRRLATPKWLLCHVVMIALVITFLRLGWWQLTRAEGGNGLSFGYTLEWPAFAAFVIIVWAREIRVALTGTRGGARVNGPTTARSSNQVDGPDAGSAPVNDVLADARAARAARTDQAAVGSADYNEYLAFLAEHPDARPSDYRTFSSNRGPMDTREEGVSAHE